MATSSTLPHISQREISSYAVPCHITTNCRNRCAPTSTSSGLPSLIFVLCEAADCSDWRRIYRTWKRRTSRQWSENAERKKCKSMVNDHRFPAGVCCGGGILLRIVCGMVRRLYDICCDAASDPASAYNRRVGKV